MNIRNRLVKVGGSLKNQLLLGIPIYNAVTVSRVYVNSSNMIQIQV